ncbi:hypothetical protein [Amycolatopsis sp. NPDC001319]|uniref:hypothetical protein n=1 Tax=unclassified Amycolatopsis TaxID=2618356 RepID=UPI00368297D8
MYTYFFADENAPSIPGYAVPQGFPLGAAHGLEMGYLFWEAQGQRGPAAAVPHDDRALD